MRIGTWNVEYAAGAVKNARRLELLQARACDIWVLTETHDDLDLFATHAPIHSDQRPTGRRGARWASIWSRFPIRARVAVNDPVRTTAALLETPAGPLLVFATVLPWHSDRGAQPAEAHVSNWSEHHRIVPEQTAEWEALRAAHPDAALCVAGDLNMDLGGKHYYGTRQGRALLRDGMRRCDLFCATETSRIRLPLSHPPIDHVLLPASWAARTSVIAAWDGRAADGLRLSDHSGLVVEVVT